MKRQNPEERLQRAVVGYLSVALPSDAAWSGIGHGGGGRLRGAILNGLGIRAGVPDIFICYRSRTLFLELKSPRGTLSRQQREFHAALARAGIETRVCRSLSDVAAALNSVGIPMMARIAA